MSQDHTASPFDTLGEQLRSVLPSTLNAHQKQMTEQLIALYPYTRKLIGPKPNAATLGELLALMKNANHQIRLQSDSDFNDACVALRLWAFKKALGFGKVNTEILAEFKRLLRWIQDRPQFDPKDARLTESLKRAMEVAERGNRDAYKNMDAEIKDFVENRSVSGEEENSMEGVEMHGEARG